MIAKTKFQLTYNLLSQKDNIMQTETLHLNTSIGVQKTQNSDELKNHQAKEDSSILEAIKRNQLVKSINALGDCV